LNDRCAEGGGYRRLPALKTDALVCASGAGASISASYFVIETIRLVQSMSVPIEPANATAMILQ
jgi:hypothetical protein